MNNFDLIKFGSRAAIGAGLVVIYDVFVEGKSLTEGFVLSDVSTVVIAGVASELTFDVLSSMFPQLYNGTVLSTIGRPLLTGIFYMYLFDIMMKGKFPYTREGKENFYIGAFGCLLTSYLENPLSSLMGLHNY